eukprot:6341661-Amphidinium_carterae.1
MNRFYSRRSYKSSTSDYQNQLSTCGYDWETTGNVHEGLERTTTCPPEVEYAINDFANIYLYNYQ